MTCYAKTCLENHTNPPTALTDGHPKIGTKAGWTAFSEFAADGYGVDQSVLDQIAAMNVTYQEDEYTPRQEEANAIHDLLDTVHILDANPCPVCGVTHYDRAGYINWEATQWGRLNGINHEIDLKHAQLRQACFNLIGQTKYDEFVVDKEGL